MVDLTRFLARGIKLLSVNGSLITIRLYGCRLKFVPENIPGPLNVPPHSFVQGETLISMSLVFFYCLDIRILEYMNS